MTRPNPFFILNAKSISYISLNVAVSEPLAGTLSTNLVPLAL